MNQRGASGFLVVALLATTAAVLAGAAESSSASRVLNLGWDAIKGFDELVLKAVWHFILWGLLGLVLGAAAGVFLWRALRDRGWMDVPWRGYRYVRWLWPVLLVGTLSLGLGSSLGVWGSGRAVKQGAREGEVFETAVVNTYAAIMVWRLQDAATDTNGTSLLERDLAEAISRLRKTTHRAQAVESGARKKVLNEVDEKSSGNAIEKWALRQAVDFIWDEQAKNQLTEHELAEWLGSLKADGVSSTEAVALAKGKIMGGAYRALDETVNSMVYPTLATIALASLGVLLGPLGIFWLIRWICLRRKTPALDPDDSSLPPLLKGGE